MSDVGFIYAIQSGGLVKIGHSKDPERRLSKINSDTPAPCRLITYFAGTREEEMALHQRFAPLCTHREWFRNEGDLADFLKSLPPPPPKALKERKPDKRTFGRPPRERARMQFSPLRQKLSDDLKAVLAAFLAADTKPGHCDTIRYLAARPDRRLRARDSDPMRQSYLIPTLFMSVNWPDFKPWPSGIDRPEPVESKELRQDIAFYHRWHPAPIPAPHPAAAEDAAA